MESSEQEDPTLEDRGRRRRRGRRHRRARGGTGERGARRRRVVRGVRAGRSPHHQRDRAPPAAAQTPGARRPVPAAASHRPQRRLARVARGHRARVPQAPPGVARYHSLVGPLEVRRSTFLRVFRSERETDPWSMASAWKRRSGHDPAGGVRSSRPTRASIVDAGGEKARPSSTRTTSLHERADGRYRVLR